MTQPLVALADELETKHAVSVQPLSLDLGGPESLTELLSVTGDREIGLLVWNAALSVMGPFLDHPLDAHLVELEVNPVLVLPSGAVAVDALVRLAEPEA